jgi:hypothetical protein
LLGGDLGVLRFEIVLKPIGQRSSWSVNFFLLILRGFFNHHIHEALHFSRCFLLLNNRLWG